MQLVSSPTTKSFFWYLTFTEEFQQQMHLFIFFPPTHHCGKMWQAWRTTILQYLQWNAFQSARPNLSLSLSQCISMLHFWRLTRLLCTAVHGYACCCARLVPGWAMQKGFAQCNLEPLRGRQELKCLTNYDKLTLRSLRRSEKWTPMKSL